MSRRRRIDMDTLVSEMSAVAAFARSSPTESDGGNGEVGRGALLSALVAAPWPALPRERRTIAGGKYEVAVGWDAEPVIEGQKNAACICILRADTSPAQPVPGVEETLRVRLSQGAETREFPLRRVFGQQGLYAAHFVPTRVGSYQFSFAGTIEGHPVEELFDSDTGQFGRVEPSADLQFPVCLGELTRVVPAVREAQSSAQTARLLAAASLSIALLGVLGAVASWRARPAGSSRPDAVIETGPSREGRQEPARPRTAEAETAESFGQDFGPALQDEIALALQPVVADFRQEIVQTVREQTEQAFQPSGWRRS
jgi:hypothetical protein